MVYNFVKPQGFMSKAVIESELVIIYVNAKSMEEVMLYDTECMKRSDQHYAMTTLMVATAVI